MEIRVQEDNVEIEGYVNAVERNSKTLFSRVGNFIEKICKGAFKRAIERNTDIHILLNHDWSKDLGSTQKGNLELHEDNIGLFARAKICSKELAEKVRNKELVGWSFGFRDIDVEETKENNMLKRNVKDLDLREVSILDNTRTPAYDGTLIMTRDSDVPDFFSEEFCDEINIREIQPLQEEHPVAIDYSQYEKIIKEMKGED